MALTMHAKCAHLLNTVVIRVNDFGTNNNTFTDSSSTRLQELIRLVEPNCSGVHEVVKLSDSI